MFTRLLEVRKGYRIVVESSQTAALWSSFPHQEANGQTSARAKPGEATRTDGAGTLRQGVRLGSFPVQSALL
jgi:hypothetical protein